MKENFTNEIGQNLRDNVPELTLKIIFNFLLCASPQTMQGSIQFLINVICFTKIMDVVRRTILLLYR